MNTIKKMALAYFAILLLAVCAQAEPMRLVMVGPPGAGKGTQATDLCQYCSLPHISTGAMLRDQIARSTELGKKAKSYVESGELVPDEVIIGMLRETLAAQAESGFVLDGFPRNLEQAKVLDGILRDLNQNLTAVIHLAVPDDVVVERLLQRGRTDDTESVIRRRLEIYGDETRPVLEYYSETDLVLKVDGVGSEEEVQARIRECLNKRSKE